MKRGRKEVVIFNLSMLDVMTGALGAVMVVVIVLLTQKIGAEEENSPIKLSENAKVLTNKALTMQSKAIAAKDEELEEKAREIAERARQVTERMSEITTEYTILKKKEDELKEREERIKDREQELIQAPEIAPSDSIAFKIPKRVLLVLDLSGSMNSENNQYNEDRISQVKAALKMFIAGMDQEYKIDLVFFPAFAKNVDSSCEDFVIKPTVDSKCLEFERTDDAYDDPDLTCYKYGYFNGELQPVTSEEQKYDFYQKLACLNAYHATPTTSAMEFALEHPEYQTAEGVILFSDGEPDAIKGGRKTIEGLINAITAKNNGKKRIFTVGVGKEFREQSKTKAVAFLQQLAEQNNGFFIGF